MENPASLLPEELSADFNRLLEKKVLTINDASKIRNLLAHICSYSDLLYSGHFSYLCHRLTGCFLHYKSGGPQIPGIFTGSIVAAVLYAYGFACFFQAGLMDASWSLGITFPAWLGNGTVIVFFSIGATLLYTLSLLRKPAGGGHFVNVSKILIFAVLILGGFWALRLKTWSGIQSSLTPFFPEHLLPWLSIPGVKFQELPNCIVVRYC